MAKEPEVQPEVQYDTAPIPDMSDLTPPPAAPTETVQEAASDQYMLGQLANHPGWGLFTDRIEKRILALKTLDGVVLEGLTPEQVGHKYLVAREAALVLTTELAYVRTVAKSIQRKRNKLVEE